jgi:hypothetical protein
MVLHNRCRPWPMQCHCREKKRRGEGGREEIAYAWNSKLGYSDEHSLHKWRNWTLVLQLTRREDYLEKSFNYLRLTDAVIKPAE